MTTALIGPHRVVGLPGIRTLPGGEYLLVAPFYHAQGGEEYFLLHKDLNLRRHNQETIFPPPDPHGPTRVNHRLGGDDSPDFPAWSRSPGKILSLDTLYRLRISSWIIRQKPGPRPPAAGAGGLHLRAQCHLWLHRLQRNHFFPVNLTDSPGPGLILTTAGFGRSWLKNLIKPCRGRKHFMFKSLRTFGVILTLLVTGLLTTALLPGEKSEGYGKPDAADKTLAPYFVVLSDDPKVD
ncbi:MAG: hypothetical protein MUP25_06010, partial [Syntrophales bacterium]|nr:hypothetical protein [Syntrophales bacterium]